MSKKNLSNQEKVFIKEYLRTLDVLKACKKAKYADTVARTKAYGWVSNSPSNEKPYLYEEIQRQLMQRLKRVDVSADRVLEEYRRLAFINIADVVQWDGKNFEVKTSEELPEELTAAISKVYKKDGKICIEFFDKKDALEKLSKYTKLLKEDDNTETVNKHYHFDYDKLSLEEKKILLKARVTKDESN